MTRRIIRNRHNARTLLHRIAMELTSERSKLMASSPGGLVFSLDTSTDDYQVCAYSLKIAIMHIDEAIERLKTRPM